MGGGGGNLWHHFHYQSRSRSEDVQTRFPFVVHHLHGDGDVSDTHGVNCFASHNRCSVSHMWTFLLDGIPYDSAKIIPTEST